MNSSIDRYKVGLVGGREGNGADVGGIRQELPQERVIEQKTRYVVSWGRTSVRERGSQRTCRKIARLREHRPVVRGEVQRGEASAVNVNEWRALVHIPWPLDRGTLGWTDINGSFARTSVGGGSRR